MVDINQNILSKYYKLYAHCLPVKGARRCIIIDFGKNQYHFIPTTLYDLLIEEASLSIKAQIDSFEAEDQATINEYFSFLIKEDLLLLVDDVEELAKFPALPLDYEQPYVIDNCIIDVNMDKVSRASYEHLIRQLSDLNCQHVQVRFFKHVSNIDLNWFLGLFSGTRVRSLELIVKYDADKSAEAMKSLQGRFNRLQVVIIHSVTDQLEEIITDGNLVYSSKPIDSKACCGQVQPYYFSTSIEHYTEALKYNTCLNKKISVDDEGYIRNCPSMSRSFGHVESVSLRQALGMASFSHHWNIKKDDIDVCRNCEFRYICTDCRAYVENPEDIYSKPLKCGYNPYTCEWEEWSTLPFKQKAIAHYALNVSQPIKEVI